MAKHGVPFEFYGERHDSPGLDANAIRDAANEPKTHVQALTDLGEDLNDDTRKVDVSVEGSISDPVKGFARTGASFSDELAQKGLYACGLMLKLADVVEAFDTETARLNAAVQSDANAALKRQDGHGEDFDSQAFIRHEITHPSKLRKDAYDAAVTTMNEGADLVATWFNDGHDAHAKQLILAGLIAFSDAAKFGITLTPKEFLEAKAAYYKTLFKGMTPEEQVAYLKNILHDPTPKITAPGTPTLDPAIIAAVGPEAQKLIAGEVATAIKSNKITTDSVVFLDAFSKQKPFAHELFSTVTPNEFGDAIKHLNDEAFSDPAKIDESKKALYSTFLHGAGSALATYSQKDPDGVYNPPSNLADTWYKAITDDDNHENASALTLMIRKGGEDNAFDGHFLGDLTDKIYDWERSKDGDPVWNPRDEGIMDPDRVKVDSTTDAESGYTSYYYSDGHATDGLANLLGGMKHSPEAAQIFFGDGSGHVDQGKIDYLVGSNPDDPSGRTFSRSDNSDEGDGLGLALEAATVGEKNDFGAELATDVFKRVAELSGKGDDWDPIPGAGGDGVWHIWPGMTDSLGTIGAGYVDDIYDMLDNNPQHGAGHLDISQDALDKVLGEIGRGEDKTGIETLTAASVIEGNDRIGATVEEWQKTHPGQPMTMEALTTSGLGKLLEGQGSLQGEVLKHLLEKSVLVDLHDEAKAKSEAAFATKAFDIATSFIPGGGKVLGETASEFSKTAFDQLKGEGLSYLKDQVGNTPDALSSKYMDAQEGALPNMIRYGTINALHAHGYMDGHDPSGNVPASLLTDGPNGTKVIRPDLYDTDGVDKFNTDGLSADQIKQIKDDWSAWQSSQSRLYAESVAQSALNGFDREFHD